MINDQICEDHPPTDGPEAAQPPAVPPKPRRLVMLSLWAFLVLVVGTMVGLFLLGALFAPYVS